MCDLHINLWSFFGQVVAMVGVSFVATMGGCVIVCIRRGSVLAFSLMVGICAGSPGWVTQSSMGGV